jgi:G:T/U-mismatch repair DNA glycosylase
MKETNPFRYFIPANPAVLILGSFPCFNGTDYGHWYYSGSGRNHLWQLLGDVFGMPATSLKEKKTLCETHGISLSDIALQVERKLGNCSDSNLHILKFNTEGIRKCIDAGVKKVLFTSRFVELHFSKMFPGSAISRDLLPSPSPTANKHIGGLAEYKEMKKRGVVENVYGYRLLKYRELLTS